MKPFLLTTCIVVAFAGSAWYKIKPAQTVDISEDAKLEETHVKKHWEKFKQKYSKVYSGSAEEESRFQKFAKNYAKILQHNAELALVKHTYTLGLNEYADLDIDEVRVKMNGYRHNEQTARNGSHYISPSFLQLPEAVDWRTHGYVTPVKNQGQCSSSWAFSATGSIEGQHFKATGKLVSLSEQNLVDCSSHYGNVGCRGGLMEISFRYIEDHGIDTEESYPYEAEDGRCRVRKYDIGANVTGYVSVTSDNEQALKEAVATVGPISVYIDASHSSFQLYNSGVYVEPDCSSTQLDHCALVVGYGTEDGEDYWLVKNSWGESWGIDGYIKMARNRNNQCGIASTPVYPLI